MNTKNTPSISGFILVIYKSRCLIFQIVYWFRNDTIKLYIFSINGLRYLRVGNAWELVML